ncbi:MAG: hypothetical protein HYV52_02015 [Parcubacteria group bacterium]|nr:hypothetical protein [Parcubacteria group bacterium]
MAHSPIDKAALAIAQRIANKLNNLIEQGHDTIAFLLAILLAFLKDGMDVILDLMLIGEIPIIGQMPGILISAILMYFLWGKGWFNTTKVKIILWGLGVFADNLPFLINDLPLTVLTVLMAWHVVRKRAKKAKKDLDKLSKKTIKELEQIDKELETA